MKRQIILIAGTIILGFAAFSQTRDQEKFHATTTTRVINLIKLPDGGFTILSSDRLFSIDANGVIRWSKEIPPISDKEYFEASSFVRDPAEGYIIAGTFRQREIPKSVIALVKTDARGNLIWSKQLSDNYLCSANAIIKTSDSGFALTGTTRGDTYVIKLDSGTNVQWTSMIGSDNTPDRGYSITETSDNGYAVTGRTYINGASDMFIAKVDNTGNLLWSKYFGDGGYDDGVKIIEARDGGLAVLGSHGTVPVFGFTTDLFLVKLKASGIFQWAKYYGGSDSDDAASFIQAEDGSYVITGISYSFNNTTSDFYNIKTDPSGNVLLSKVDTGWGQVILTNGGGYVIGGFDQKNFPYDGVLIRTNSNLATCNSRNVSTVTHISTRSVNANFHLKTRIFTATVLPLTSVNSAVSVSQICSSDVLPSNITESQVKNQSDFKISFYPNPVKEELTLQFFSRQLLHAQIRILNVQGKLFFSKNIVVHQGENKEIINTNFLSKGNYFLSMILRNGDKKFVPFIKE